MITSSSLYLRDFVDDVTTALIRHFTEDRVLAVQMRLRAEGDEELRTVRAWPCVCHGKQVRLVEDKIRMDFVSELVARAAGACPERATSLDHEAVDHPMKAQPVVEVAGCPDSCLRVGILFAAGGKTHEVVDCLGSLITEKLQSDIAVIGMQRYRLLCHL